MDSKMGSWVKLTTDDAHSTKVWVNLAIAATIVPLGSYTVIRFAEGHSSLAVSVIESPEEILRKAGLA